MGSILNEGDRAEIVRRVRSLSISSTGRWGTMDVTGMLQHLRLSARMALGAVDTRYGDTYRFGINLEEYEARALAERLARYFDKLPQTTQISSHE